MMECENAQNGNFKQVMHFQTTTLNRYNNDLLKQYTCSVLVLDKRNSSESLHKRRFDIVAGGKGVDRQVRHVGQ